jgi:hypothetical protein
VTAYFGTENLIKPGADKHLNAFQRTQADMVLGGGLHLVGRAEVSKQTDGGNATTPSDFTTLELYGGAYRPVLPNVAIAGLYGYTLPLEGGQAILTKYPQTYSGGLMLGDARSRAWLLLTVGHHDAAGPGTHLIFAGSWPLKDSTFAVADGAIGGGQPFVRAGIAVRVGQ